MSPLSFWVRIAIGTAIAVGSVVLVPIPAPATTRLSIPVGVAIGAVLGGALFVALTRQAPRLPGRCQLTRAQLSFLLAWSCVEELLWRRLLLGGLALFAGSAVGLVVTTALFTASHPHSRLTHGATGTVFGGAYVATGRLAAAIASHVAYNLFVAGSRPLRTQADRR